MFADDVTSRREPKTVAIGTRREEWLENPLSGMPTTAASATAGWQATSASSTSAGEMLVPPRMMMSFLRDTNQRSSPSPRRIRSPV
jgi:hypothetical protein